MSDIDYKYIALVKNIITNGVNSDDRTGVGTKSIFGATFETALKNDILPAISVRRVAPRFAFEELIFMLNGKSQTKELEAMGINIWKGNTSREFLDNIGLHNLEEGDFGRMYGKQLRDFTGTNSVAKIEIKFDQLKYIINEIKNNPNSRRIIATHYNPAEGSQGVLFPCHIMTQFNVRNGNLDCLFWMRSSDVGYGLPYNLMYYGMLTHMLAKLCNLKAGNLLYQSGDCHLYNDQLESGMFNYMQDNIDNKAFNYSTPKFIINKELNSLDDMLGLTWQDIAIQDYNPSPDFKNKAKMAI